MTDFTALISTTNIVAQSPSPEGQVIQDTTAKPQADVTPAVDVELSGRHLIEASAGTGKTWTLTGIVLRLLIEARRAPEHIIATTFTRAAAAEMRQRIHDRLVAFYQLLQWVDGLRVDIDHQASLYPDILQITPERRNDTQADHNLGADTSTEIEIDGLNQDPAADIQAAAKRRMQAQRVRRDWLIEQARYVRLETSMQDPINLHLIGYLLDHVHSYPMKEAIRRTAMVLTTLDKLFVGTLDSLAQKWLTEYSSETGHQQGMGIIENSDIEHITEGIIHDELRQFQSRLYHEQPRLYALMDQQGKLTTAADHRKYVTRSLNFISAPIDEIRFEKGFDFDAYEKLIYDFSQLDLADIQPYLDLDYRKSQGFRGRSNLINHFDAIIEVHQKAAQYQLTFGCHLNERENKMLTSLQDARYPNEDGKIKNFNKDRQKEHQTLFELETISKLMALLDMIEGLNQHILLVLATLNRHIVLAVRDRLPIVLEERGKTTFSLQMVRLNQALTGRQGEKLARYIRHHYPVALIDESQDINGEQATMIERIYLPKRQSSKAKVARHEFLLLVGDPKQAIYGFRGGDVTNYNHMKSQFDKSTIWTLDVNRRSNAGVIDALNGWFGMADAATGENKLAQLGTSIYYQHIKADKLTYGLSWYHTPHKPDQAWVTEVLSEQPVSLLHLPYDKELEYDEFEITARHIAILLSSAQTLNGQPIQPSDIGVLARAKKDLKRVEDELVKLNVPTLTTSDVSIFETVMAEDVAALLSAMLYPYRHDMINRVLTSHLYGLSIKDIQIMMANHESGVRDGDSEKESPINRITDKRRGYQDFITHLKEGAQRWQHFGILSALHYLLDKNPMQPKGVWQALAAHPEGDRHIMDLRHVMDILAQYGLDMGEYELLAWFRQNIDAAPSSDWAKQYPLPTESGVQLMTIHKSKGLEFPIVYVLGMGDASRQSGNKEDYGLYLYNAHQSPSASLASTSPQPIGNQRRFSPLKDSATMAGYYADMETQESFDESRRLGYVAFTRASEQLYVVLKDPHNKSGFELKPMFYWFESVEAKFELPDRLKGVIGMLRGHDVNACYAKLITLMKDSQSLGIKPKTHQPTTEPIAYPAFFEVMKKTFFYGWAKTSFTALARQLDAPTQDLAVVDERIDDAIDIDMTDMVRVSASSVAQDDALSQKPTTDIRFTFIKGANAGTFLHQVFEQIVFTNKPQWSQVIDRAISSHQLPLIYSSAENQGRQLQRQSQNTDTEGVSERQPTDINPIDASKHEALIGWIEEVLYTPLLASNQPLMALDKSQRFAELAFNMGLSEQFKPQEISKRFEQYLPDETDKHITLIAQNKDHLYRYLRGEIDLVYEYAGKYYIVDYKSNFLGNSLSNYDEKTLRGAMSKAGYWLQAAIYQVALHRFLSIRISDYLGNEETYLGAVEYVFLRGVWEGDTQTCRNYGRVTWDIPIELIKSLDQLFGLPNQ